MQKDGFKKGHGGLSDDYVHIMNNLPCSEQWTHQNDNQEGMCHLELKITINIKWCFRYIDIKIYMVIIYLRLNTYQQLPTEEALQRQGEEELFQDLQQINITRC